MSNRDLDVTITILGEAVDEFGHGDRGGGREMNIFETALRDQFVGTINVF